VLARIEGWGSKSAPTSGSAWDNREEDTWIDKL
jgi:DNA polymerase-3 subunit epsilon